MKIRLKETPEQIELVKAMASKERQKAIEAQEMFAAFIAPVVQKVLQQAGTAPIIYSDMPYNEDDSPSIPVDLYYGLDAGHITVWSQSMAGGLPTSFVTGMQELKIATYRLDSAVALNRKYARRSRLDVVSAAITRMTQEVLIKQERNAWAVILKALGEASTGGQDHLITSTTQDVFQVDDLNRLLTLNKRLNESFANGTPDAQFSNGVTDLFISPEIKEQVRAFAYQPMNTRAVPDTAESTALGLPDNVREQIWNSAGIQEIYGVTLHELIELGLNKKYNVLFQTYAPASVAHGSGNFDQTDEIIIGVDLSKDSFKRPIARNADSGSTFTVLADDQFYATRSDKMGWYGSLEEGRICLDARSIVGIIC